jgi:ElaB/YqjD/DUF883 family membrane-anchored ribosome-binding protein
MGQTADQLRQEIDQKRDNAAQKIDQIETRVQDTAQQAKDTVRDTAMMARDTVTETLDQTVTKVSETVDQTFSKMKEGFDVKRQAEERPLVTIGAALVGGFLLGGLTGGDKGEHRSSEDRTTGGSSTRSSGGVTNSLREAARTSGLDDAISNIASTLMGSLTERIRSTVDEAFPQLAEMIKSKSGDGAQSSMASGSTTRELGTTGTVVDSSGRTAPYYSDQDRGAGTTG